MRFIHTADLHLGRLYRGELPIDIMKVRKEELWQNFENTVKICHDEKVDLLLISGDIYEREYFTLKDMERFSDILGILDKTEVFILPGNHDYLDENSLYNKVDFKKNIHIFRKNSYFDIEELNTRIHGIPWTNSETEMNYNFSLLEKGKNIIMIHGTADGKDYCPVDMEKLSAIKADYIALGHIHKRGKILENAYYPGSPEGLNFKETGNHGIIAGKIDDRLKITFLNTQIRKYNTIEIELNSSMNINEVQKTVSEKLQGMERDLNRIIFTGEYENINYLMEIMKAKRGWFYNEYVNNAEEFRDIEEIYRENSNNIIGEFIRMAKEDREVMDIGLEALLEAADDN